MKISPKQYAKALFFEVLNKDNKEVLPIIDRFFDILKSDNSLSKIEKIISHFNDFWKKEHSLVEAEITTARLLDDNLKKEIVNYLLKLSQSDKIKIEEKQDKKIIGGFVIKYNDKILDASIKNKIKNFKNNLIQ